MSDEKFRDWIPEGEDPGAIGDGGYRDFVPTPEAQAEAQPEQPQPEAPVEAANPEYVAPPLEQQPEQLESQPYQAETNQSILDKLNPFKHKEEGGSE